MLGLILDNILVFLYRIIRTGFLPLASS